MNKGMYTSNKDDWETPDEIFDEYNTKFGFDIIDVCANENNHKCDNYFTQKDDGLRLIWTGKCWMNPPYGREIGEWVKKAMYSSLYTDAIVVGLLPARTDSKWFHDFVYGFSDIVFIRGRLKFKGAKWNAPFPSMIAIWGNK